MKRKYDKSYKQEIRAPEQILAFSSSSLRDAAGTLLLLHAMLAIIVQFLKFEVTENFSLFLSSGWIGFVSSALIMQGICILLPTIFVIYHYNIPAKIVPGILPTSGGWILMSATIGIPAAIVFTGLNNGFVYILSKMGLHFSTVSSSIDSFGGGLNGFVIILFLSVLLPGIVEELMFRGVIQGSMEHKGRGVLAVIIPAFAFAVFHADIMFFIAPFLAGLLLGFVRHKTGTVYASIITHVVMNLTILLMHPLLPQLTFEYLSQMPTNALLYASLLASAVASVALIPMLIAFSSVKSPPVKKNIEALFPINFKFVIGLLILIGSTLFNYFAKN